MAQITGENLTLGYEGKAVLRDLNFTVEAGDYLCIVGANGSGKTTLMKTLLGLQPPLGGTIRFGDGLTRREIGYLPQQTQVQRDFPALVREIVRSGFQGRCGLRPWYTAREKEEADRMLQKVGAADLAGRCYRELSGGQQQRVLLARALCAARKALLLDEPVTGLDPEAAAQMYRLIGDLHAEGVTILMITHDLGPALQQATRILHIATPVFCGSPRDYLRRTESGKGDPAWSKHCNITGPSPLCGTRSSWGCLSPCVPPCSGSRWCSSGSPTWGTASPMWLSELCRWLLCSVWPTP